LIGFDRGLSREVGALVVDEHSIMHAARTALVEMAYVDAWAEGESLTLADVSVQILDEASDMDRPAQRCGR
jgi:hypothetical protein